MMRRTAPRSLVAVFALALVAPLAGCGKESPPPPKDATPPITKEKPAPLAAENPAEKSAGTPSPELDPAHPSYRKPAPALYRVRFLTTKGEFDVLVTREWAPQGADRFYALVKAGFFNDTRFFRVVPDFMVQFGIHASPQVSAKWENATIPDDSLRQSNTRGTITYATRGKDSRTTQVFINFKDKNSFLDGQGFTPFGKVTEGMEVVDSINAEYGEAPQQPMITRSGNAYLDTDFPNLDRIKSARIIE
jgi:peptidyl-prolyl cis-trans isomerase A (cyclophilin A)